MKRAAVGLALVAALSLSPAAIARRGAAPGCSPRNLSLSLTVTRTSGSQVATAGLYHFRGRTCHLRTTLTLRLLTKLQRGKILPVEGNPARVSLDLVLHVRRRASVSWRWRNWCGSGDKRALTVLTSTGGGTGSLARPPACLQRAKRSTLTRLG